jgi:hypothetical protein
MEIILRSRKTDIPYMSEEQRLIEMAAIKVLYRVDICYLLLLAKYDLGKYIDVVDNIVVHSATKVAMGLADWEKAINRLIAMYERRLTKVLRYLHNPDSRIQFYDDSLKFLNQVDELKQRTHHFLAEIPKPAVIKRTPSDAIYERSDINGTPPRSTDPIFLSDLSEYEEVLTDETVTFDNFQICTEKT